MIVTCPSCQTRFRFPPDKIGPDGARIRCSRCRNVFAVSPGGKGFAEGAGPAEARPTPAGAAPAPAPPPPAPATDPFLADLGPDPFGLAETGALAPEPPARGESREVGGELQASLDDPGAPPSAADLALEDHTPRPPPLPPSSRRDELRLGDEATHVEDVPLEPAELPAASGPRDVAYALPADLPPPAPLAQAAEPAPGQGVARAEGDARPRRAVRLGAAAMNALSLALLVGLAAALAGWRGELGRRFGGGRAEAVTTARVTGGLFDTAEGARVLVVRGEVEAHQPMDGVRVRVALLEGARTVAAAEGLAGAAADPEQVFAATNLAQIATLRSALDARAAGPLAPGTRAPFLVVFPAPLPDLAGLEVRATAEPIHRH